MKLLRGQEIVQTRQLKSDVEAKKREIIEASDLINRVTLEIDEVRKERGYLTLIGRSKSHKCAS